MGWTGLDLIDGTVGPWKAVFLVLSGPGCSRLILIGLDENRHENRLLWQSCLSEFVPFPTATYSKRGKKAFVFLFLFLKSSRSSHHYRPNRFFSTQLHSPLHTQTQKTRSSPSPSLSLSAVLSLSEKMEEESQCLKTNGEEDFYENIEAPKFVDLNAPDHYHPGDDRYWFCLRVGKSCKFNFVFFFSLITSHLKLYHERSMTWLVV